LAPEKRGLFRSEKPAVPRQRESRWGKQPALLPVPESLSAPGWVWQWRQELVLVFVWQLAPVWVLAKAKTKARARFQVKPAAGEWSRYESGERVSGHRREWAAPKLGLVTETAQQQGPGHPVAVRNWTKSLVPDRLAGKPEGKRLPGQPRPPGYTLGQRAPQNGCQIARLPAYFPSSTHRLPGLSPEIISGYSTVPGYPQHFSDRSSGWQSFVNVEADYPSS